MRGLSIFGFATALVAGRPEEVLLPCGDAFYLPSRYTCYDSDFLCPVLDGVPTLRCGPDCYLTSMYSCSNGKLVYPPVSSGTTGSPPSSTTTIAAPGTTCTEDPLSFQINAPPYNNYFYSDCNSASQVVVTSPESDSNLTIISPRIIVAWPAGNSGVVAYFAPENGVNGTLGIQVVNSSTPLSPIYNSSTSENATVGISAQVEFNSSAILRVAILGSIRTIRDFSEGPSLLQDVIQDAMEYEEIENGVVISRLWLDNVTTSTMSFTSSDSNSTVQLNTTGNATITFEPGTYTFNASFDYPQLISYSAQEVLNDQSADLIAESPILTDSLAFLSYTTKLTAGAWRFLTYFGRDSMISALLLEPVLSAGDGGALEAVLAGVLERVNRTDGSVCHEETIGDYATYLNLQNNITSTEPLCDYKMIDTDDFLPILMDHYFLRNTVGGQRVGDFLNTTASIFPENSNLTYGQLAQRSAEKIVNLASPFAASDNQTKENLIHLKPNEVVGEWRDSTYGLGGGRIPFDVNTALVPSALRSIAALSRADILDFDADNVDAMAQVWEDETLQFFEITVPRSEATQRLISYAESINIASQTDAITSDENVTFYAIALDGNNNLSKVEVMHTDDCFRHFLLNTTDQAQLTSFLNASANNVRRRFPAGLLTDVGLVVANPALAGSEEEIYRANFTTSAYHGTVVWGWQLAMMARGLELQLSRCNSTGSSSNTSTTPEFCNDQYVYNNVKSAYNSLWDVLEENEDILSNEVWSWTYDQGDNRFNFIDLGALPPPAGVNPTESNAVQLWSLTFLAVRRDEALK